MTITPQQRALWALDVTRRCLIEAGDDVDSGMVAADYIISTQQIPEEFLLSIDVHGRKHKDKGPGGGQFVPIPDSESGIPKKKLLKGWSKPIEIAKDKVGVVGKFIWNNISRILDKIPGSKLVRRKAKELYANLERKYGKKGLVGIAALGLAIHFREIFVPEIPTILPLAAEAIGSTIPYVTGTIIGASHIISTAVSAIAASPLGLAVIAPSTTILGTLVAIEAYRQLRKLFKVPKVKSQYTILESQKLMDELNKEAKKSKGVMFSLNDETNKLLSEPMADMESFTEQAKNDLIEILDTNSVVDSLPPFIEKYRNNLTDLLTEAQLALSLNSGNHISDDVEQSYCAKAAAIAGVSASETSSKIMKAVADGIDKDVKQKVLSAVEQDTFLSHTYQDKLLRTLSYSTLGNTVSSGLQQDIDRSPLSIKLSAQPMALFSVDAHGMEHKGKGPGGGQFVKKSTGGDAEKDSKSTTASSDKPKDTTDDEKTITSKLVDSWPSRKISITIDKIAKVNEAIWNGVSNIIDKVPGGAVVRGMASKLVEGLRSRYGVAGMLGIVASAVISTYAVDLFVDYFDGQNVITDDQMRDIRDDERIARRKLEVERSEYDRLVRKYREEGMPFEEQWEKTKSQREIFSKRANEHDAAYEALTDANETRDKLPKESDAKEAIESTLFKGKVWEFLTTGAVKKVGAFLGTKLAGALVASSVASPIASMVLPPAIAIVGSLVAIELYKKLRSSFADVKPTKAEYTEEESKKFMDELNKASKPNTPDKSSKEAPLSIDAQGREHKDTNPGKGQFVSNKRGRSKHERLESSPFTFQSQLRKEQISELDVLAKELDGNPGMFRGAIRIAREKFSEWKNAIKAKATQIIDTIPGGKKVREKLASIKEKLTKRYGAKTTAAVIGSGYALWWATTGSISVIVSPVAAAPMVAIPAMSLMLPGLALAELKYQLNKSKNIGSSDVIASVENELTDTEIEEIAKNLIDELTEVTREVGGEDAK